MLLQVAFLGLQCPALAGQVGLGLVGGGLHLLGDILAHLGELQDGGAVDHHDLGLGRVSEYGGDESCRDSGESESAQVGGHFSILWQC